VNVTRTFIEHEIYVLFVEKIRQILFKGKSSLSWRKVMAMERLGSSLYEALRKVFRSPVVDEETVKQLALDIQRALLLADVNVKLVLEISNRIEDRALKEKFPPGISRREHVTKVVYEELTRFLGEKPVPLKIKTGKRNVFMLVGIQGSGKTTGAAKLARYSKRED